MMAELLYLHVDAVVYYLKIGGQRMAIKCHLSRMLGERKMKMTKLAQEASVAKNTVLGLYHESAKGITFEVMAKLCTALKCQPGDLFEYIPDEELG